MAEKDDSVSRFSAEPLSADELRHWRRNMEHFDHLGPLIESYEKATTIGKFFVIVGGWIVGLGVGIVGVLNGLSALHLWPFK